jgi:hypothetical protein
MFSEPSISAPVNAVAPITKIPAALVESRINLSVQITIAKEIRFPINRTQIVFVRRENIMETRKATRKPPRPIQIAFPMSFQYDESDPTIERLLKNLFFDELNNTIFSHARGQQFSIWQNWGDARSKKRKAVLL